MQPRKLILRSPLSPGDIVMLTAAVRDLHACYPGRFLTDVRTRCPALWDHNPHLTPLREEDPDVTVIDCHYPLINDSHHRPVHCLNGFIDFLNQQLDLRIQLSACRGDIHLSPQEKAWYSQVHEVTGQDTPFWIIAAGGKYDVTIKWWSPARYQRVVDHFRDRILFVQVGQQGHHHPRLRGVVDLRGQTSLREMVRLVHHARGVLCPVTCLMHLAAAVETRDQPGTFRPCVVVAGGREPVHWEAYPGHKFLHTIGALNCCATSACWKDRTLPLGDGDHRDDPSHLCVDVRRGLPGCMDMITPRDVIHAIETYHQGGRLRYLEAGQRAPARQGIHRTRRNPFDNLPLTESNARLACERFLRNIPPPPRTFYGRGVVICAGGVRYFTNAWVCIRRLRQLGCTLPIQVWHLGPLEMSPTMSRLLRTLDATTVDALEVRRRFPVRRLGGWELKAYSLLHARFREVLFLDADNVPVRDPSCLFEDPDYRRTGALFWPDRGGPEGSPRVWKMLGLANPAPQEFESGQMVLDKARCWDPLRLALWFNEHSDFFYRLVHGDKETFHIAFRKLQQPFGYIATPVQPLRGTMCQHDGRGRRLFQHRGGDKWTYFGVQLPVPGFLHEAACREALRELRSLWPGRIEALERHRGLQDLAFPPPEPVLPTIRVGMISCPQRTTSRNKTLDRLHATDLAVRELLLEAQGGAGDTLEGRDRNALRLLQRFLTGDEMYLLFLEDDLGFNRWLGSNLARWPALRRRAFMLASLYNPGFREEACYPEYRAYRMQPEAMQGSQALLLARAAVEHLVAHWHDHNLPLDRKLLQLAGALPYPVLCHPPSLVQHLGRIRTRAAGMHEAADFDPNWRAHGRSLL